MKLVPMRLLLEDAVLKNKAVAAINISNMETILALLETAAIENASVIIQVAPIQMEVQQITYEEIVALVNVFGKRYDVRAALHLDHATKVEDCYKAIRAGFTSVMYDGSLKSYEENKNNTKKVVDFAKEFSVTVEAELGKVGGAEGHSNENQDSYMTDPLLVKDFVRYTSVDCLAVAIGNAHGFYKSQPRLDFERLKNIKNMACIPLVLHGGTGISEDDIDLAIETGINKINFFTEVDRSFVEGFLKAYQGNHQVYMMAAQESGRQAMMKEIALKIALCERRSRR
ncbi:class II fructose-bisphosphate aldolase [Vallitalea okinawensis]|uniref:class II fructose-bisphosphate aldolase n=1 Tax=Vallitalea okinawensis TaxID=2078660 RepID=UPI0013004893|nr:class II fructose-bisphosphate aldolase [Vallitalea okinawensis]